MYESKAMLEVWDWKDKAAEEVSNYDLKTALDMRINQSLNTVTMLHLTLVDLTLE